ncbi:leucine-rich repeat-containing protein [Tanacetum coccineum]
MPLSAVSNAHIHLAAHKRQFNLCLIDIFHMSNESSLFNLPHLQTLNLASNNFTGSQIPSEIGRFSNSLTHLNLSDCRFSGQVPMDITLLHKLVSLDLNDDLKLEPHVFINMWPYADAPLAHLNSRLCQGTIPNVFKGFVQLEGLNLNGNRLEGGVPSSLSKCESLRVLDLGNNHLNGTFPGWLGELRFLQVLVLKSNNFHGNIQPSFAVKSPFPGFQVLNLSRNRWPYADAPLAHLNSRLCQGTIPNVFEGFVQLEGLNLNGNRLEGGVPSSLSKCESLRVLDLGNNHLNGTFPGWLGELRFLQVLVLKSNNFHGNIQPSFAVKSPFPGFQVLNLSRNRFVGQLPTKYFQNFNSMKNVVKNNTKPQYLDMGGKYYSFVVAVKGVYQDIPRLFVSLTIIDLSNNYFERGIPEIIANLSALKVLNLSHNSLNGRIPDSLGIKGLEVLDLSQNHLVGRIPGGTQFNTFDENSFAGNLGLCGFPLPKKCSEPTHKPQLEEQEDKSGFTWEFCWNV